MTEFWVCFSCCVAEQPQPKRRRRIDRSMIGEPTNFVHMTHVGSGDMGTGVAATSSEQWCPPSVILLVQHHRQTAAPRRTTCTQTVTTTVLNTTSPSPNTAVVSYQTGME
ncbi:hypothetical protein NFI96_014849 [Prochilodus magdalenae]|nr:hypothetical protein NFI96_014849 [Prochilodus magdalenae]